MKILERGPWGLRDGRFSDRTSPVPVGTVEMDNTSPFISAAWEREDVRFNGNPIDCCYYFRNPIAPENVE